MSKEFRIAYPRENFVSEHQSTITFYGFLQELFKELGYPSMRILHDYNYETQEKIFIARWEE